MPIDAEYQSRILPTSIRSQKRPSLSSRRLPGLATDTPSAALVRPDLAFADSNTAHRRLTPVKSSTRSNTGPVLDVFEIALGLETKVADKNQGRRFIIMPVINAVAANVGRKVSVHTMIDMARLRFFPNSGKRCKYENDRIATHHKNAAISQIL